MNIEKPNSEIFSGHRYIKEDGMPDYERIFSVKESPLRRHIDSWLLKHLDNQPDMVKNYDKLNIHLKDCEECMSKLKQRDKNVQADLPFG